MPKPSTPASFGAVLPGLTIGLRRTHHPRFAQIRAVTAGTMPTLLPGQIWEDMDPRCAGRSLLVETVNDAGTVTVRTLTPRTVPARTPAVTHNPTVGRKQTIAAVRFRPGARGFRLTGALIRLRPDGSVINADTLKRTLAQVAPKVAPTSHQGTLPREPAVAPPKIVATQSGKAGPLPAGPLHAEPAKTAPVKTVSPTLFTPTTPAPKAPAPKIPALKIPAGESLHDVAYEASKQVLASMLRAEPTAADLRVAEVLCGMLGAAGAVKWLATLKYGVATSWIVSDYRTEGPCTLLGAAAMKAEGL